MDKFFCFQTIFSNFALAKRINQQISTINNMDLTGRIIAVMPAQSGVSQRSGNSWMSQDYVLEVPGQYPRRMVFRVFGEDRIRQFNIQNGEDVTVQFDIDAHEYQGRWFNDIRAFNILHGAAIPQPGAPMPGAEAMPGAAPFPPQQPAPFPPQQSAPQAASFPPAQEPASEGSNDDLPF